MESLVGTVSRGCSFAIALLAAVLVVAPDAARGAGQADSVVVDKSDRELYLMQRGKVWKSYPIGLGFAPEGHKRQQGDGRTPEGEYILDWRNPRSQFYLSLHISYPNAEDREQARARGVSPGGDIFVHGRHDPTVGQHDWTWGCIAVSDAAMDEIWAAVPDGTPIIIRP